MFSKFQLFLTGNCRQRWKLYRLILGIKAFLVYIYLQFFSIAIANQNFIGMWKRRPELTYFRCCSREYTLSFNQYLLKSRLHREGLKKVINYESDCRNISTIYRPIICFRGIYVFVVLFIFINYRTMQHQNGGIFLE